MKQHDNQSYFGTVAAEYDRLQPIIAGPHYSTGIETIIKLIPCMAEDDFTLVELGCGTATISDKILSAYQSAHVIAVDAQPEMLEVASGKLREYGARAEIVEADLLGYAIPKCDFIISSFTLHHLSPSDLQQLMTRARQSLSPDGYLIVLDSMRMDHNWDRHIAGLNWSWNDAHVLAHIESGATTEQEIADRWAFKRRMKAEGKDVEHKHRVEDHYQCFEQAGFAEYAVVWRTFSITILVAAGSIQ